MCIKVILYAVASLLSLFGGQVAQRYGLIPYVGSLGGGHGNLQAPPSYPLWPSSEDFGILYEAAGRFNCSALPPPDLLSHNFFPPNRCGCPPRNNTTSQHKPHQEESADQSIRQLLLEILYSVLLCELRLYSGLERAVWMSFVGFRFFNNKQPRPEVRETLENLEWCQGEGAESLKTENEELKKNYAALSHIHELCQTNAQDLETRLVECQTGRQELQSKLYGQHKADLADSGHRVRQLEKEIGEIRSLLQGKTQALESQATLLETVQHNLIYAREEIQGLRGGAERVLQLEKEHANLNSSLQKEKGDSKAQSQEASRTHEAKTRALEETLGACQSELENLRREIEELREKVCFS